VGGVWLEAPTVAIVDGFGIARDSEGEGGCVLSERRLPRDLGRS